MKIYKTILILLVIQFFTVDLIAEKKEFIREVFKQFPIASNGEVSLENKHGKVNVTTWDKDLVEINVTIRVLARSENTADAVFERINFEFYNDDLFVKAETKISNGNWHSGFAETEEFTIDYEVILPKSVRLELVNKHGNVFVAKLDNNADISIQYGDLRLEGLSKDLRLKMGYGSSTIGETRNAYVQIKYGKVKLENAKNVEMDSRYSKIHIYKANDIKSLSKYDTYSIGEVRDLNNEGKYDNFTIDIAENIHLNSKYTDIFIGSLVKGGEFDLKYGDLEIEELKSGFSKLTLNGEYIDFKIDVEDSAHYKMDVITKYGSIKYPDNFEKRYLKIQDNRTEVQGYVGNANPSSFIIARLEYGGLKIK